MDTTPEPQWDNRAAATPVPAVRPLAAAVLVAAVGACAWALIVKMTGYEVGYVAWGIGALIGVAATAAGGRGTGLAMSCALLAVAAIGGGKLLSAHFAVQERRDLLLEQLASRDAYDAHLEDARAVQGLETETDLKGFMIEHGFTEHTAVPDIPDEEYTDFVDNTLDDLRAAHADPPDYEDWCAERTAMVTVVTDGIPLVEVVKQGLSPIDLLFVALGVMSAFKLVAARGRPPGPTRAGSAESGPT